MSDGKRLDDATFKPSQIVMIIVWDVSAISGVDLLKILGQTKILGGKWCQWLMNIWAFFNYWGHVPCLSPKSTSMSVIDNLACSSVSYMYLPFGIFSAQADCPEEGFRGIPKDAKHESLPASDSLLLFGQIYQQGLEFSQWRAEGVRRVRRPRASTPGGIQWASLR